jgi:signal recognition particle GTPase
MSTPTREQVKAVLAWAEMPWVNDVTPEHAAARTAIFNAMEKAVEAYSSEDAMSKASEILAAKVRTLERELAAEKARAESQAERIRYMEGATSHAGGTPLSLALARAEKAEAEAHELQVSLDWTRRYVSELLAQLAEREQARRDGIDLIERLESQLARKDEALRSLTPLLRHRPDGDIAWRGNPSARCGYLKVSDILLIEKAQEALT